MRSAVRRRLSEWGFSQWWKAIVTVVLASTALFGGLDTVDTSVTTFNPGDEFSDGEFTVKVERATLVRELRAGNTVLGGEKPGRRYLGVVTQLRNDGTTPGRLAGELDLRNTVDPEYVVAPRESLTVDGQTWAVADVRHLPRYSTPGTPPLPEGTVLTVVTMDRSGSAAPDYGTGVLTDGQRRWRGDAFGAQPGQLQWSFLIPDDAVPTAVDVTRLDGSILIRLQL
jgi:hypothetical protein